METSGCQALGWGGGCDYKGVTGERFFGITGEFCMLNMMVVTRIYTYDRIS